MGDFAVILLDETVDYLYGILSIDSHNCTEGGGRNIIMGGNDHDIIVGKYSWYLHCRYLE